MTTRHVYVSRDLGPEALGLLKESGCEIVVHPDRDRPPSRSELLDGVAGASGIVTLLSETMDGELFDHAGPQLAVVSAVSVGTDNIDIEAAARRGITVTNTPDVLTGATADLAMGLILAVNRRIVEADAFLRRRESWSWGPRFFLGRDLEDEVLGIVGYGRIGAALARRARAFGMKIIAAGTGPARDGVERLPLQEMLSVADVVSLHAPLTAETRHLLGPREFASMKPRAVVINTARGPLIDEGALVEALDSGRLRGAGLDVFEQEPKIHPGLLVRDNVVLTPHIGSAGEQTRQRMAMLAAENTVAVLTGRDPKTPVACPTVQTEPISTATVLDKHAAEKGKV